MRTRFWVIKGATRVIQAEMGQFQPRSSLGEAKRRWTWPAGAPGGGAPWLRSAWTGGLGEAGGESLSCVRLSVTPWTVAHQAPLSMGFPRQEDSSGLPFRSPRDLPHPGIEPASLMSPALAGRFLTTSATWEAVKGWASPQR